VTFLEYAPSCSKQRRKYNFLQFHGIDIHRIKICNIIPGILLGITLIYTKCMIKLMYSRIQTFYDFNTMIRSFYFFLFQSSLSFFAPLCTLLFISFNISHFFRLPLLHIFINFQTYRYHLAFYCLLIVYGFWYSFPSNKVILILNIFQSFFINKCILFLSVIKIRFYLKKKSNI